MVFTGKVRGGEHPGREGEEAERQGTFLAWAAITKCHKLGAWISVPHSSGSWKSKIRVPAWLDEGSFPHSQLVPFFSLNFYYSLVALHREANGTPLQYSCLDNPMDRGGYSLWSRWELDTTQWLHFHFSLSCIAEGNGNPIQCSCLENPRDNGAWWAAVYGVAQSWTRLKWLSSSSSSCFIMLC